MIITALYVTAVTDARMGIAHPVTDDAAAAGFRTWRTHTCALAGRPDELW